jgi:hypothetical protein
MELQVGCCKFCPALRELRSSPEWPFDCKTERMIRKLPSGKFRLYSKKKDAKSGRRKNLGTFKSRQAAQAHERAVQYFKRAH